MTPSNPSGEDPELAPRSDGENGDLDFVEYYDDGEWHVALIDGTKCVASGSGDSPEAARKALFGRADFE